MIAPAPDPSGPAPELLLRVAAEVDLCRTLVHQVEAALAPLIQSRSVGGAAPQAIDRLDQILADLVLCLQGRAGGLSDEAVLAMLHLDDVRRRLAGQDIPAAEVPVVLF